MIKKSRNKHPTTLENDALAEVEGGRNRRRRRPPPRVPVNFNPSQKGRRTDASTDGDYLYIGGRRTVRMDRIL